VSGAGVTGAPGVIVVMAKAPVPGYAKTRLIPALGADGAAALAARLLTRAVDHAQAACAGGVDLCVAPHADHPAFATLAAAHPDLTISRQGEGDLGARMARAFEHHLPRAPWVLMTGIDAPGLDAAMLQAAAAVLASPASATAPDAVFVPALDGGYALIGLRGGLPEVPDLFSDMPWSTATVMHLTRKRLQAAGLRWTELAPLPDIDEPADLIHLPAGWHPGP
jgi:uncharacterized protein